MFFLKEYKAKKIKAPDIFKNRDRILSSKNKNLIFLLDKRFSWMKRYINGKKIIVELGSGNGCIKKIIDEAGLQVIDYKTFNSSFQISMGETIIRTLLPSYKILYNRLLPDNKDIWQEFKDAWVDEIVRLLMPFTDEEWLHQKSNPMLYHSFFCKKV